VKTKLIVDVIWFRQRSSSTRETLVGLFQFYNACFDRWRANGHTKNMFNAMRVKHTRRPGYLTLVDGDGLWHLCGILCNNRPNRELEVIYLLTHNFSLE